MTKLEDIYFNNDAASSITDYNNKVNAMTAKDVQDVIVKYLLKDHYLHVVLQPTAEAAKKKK
jgi:predicted Zn-dependent peptidase